MGERRQKQITEFPVPRPVLARITGFILLGVCPVHTEVSWGLYSSCGSPSAILLSGFLTVLQLTMSSSYSANNTLLCRFTLCMMLAENCSQVKSCKGENIPCSWRGAPAFSPSLVPSSNYVLCRIDHHEPLCLYKKSI